MAVSAGRAILYFLGVILVVFALAMFFFQTGLDRWVPVGLLAAGVLLIIGLAVMSFADNAPEDRSRVRSGHHDDDGGDVTVVHK
ncbi:MAG: hypothetical protein QOC71_710 [Thermoplasmata archaeon]|jgi:uncharacterized membrane protein|nr:hypothetical protein [Thermoplasmata archaeon]